MDLEEFKEYYEQISWGIPKQYKMLKPYNITLNTITLAKGDKPKNLSPNRTIYWHYIKLAHSSELTVLPDYIWDGPSGPTIDVADFMRGSLVHDALYDLMRLGLLDYTKVRDDADRLLQAVCLEDGMRELKAWRVYEAVHLAGKPYAKPQHLPSWKTEEIPIDVTLIEPIGGSGIRKADTDNAINVDKVQEVIIGAGSLIDSVQLKVYTLGDNCQTLPQHGGNGGTPFTFTLAGDEYLTGISGKYNKFSILLDKYIHTITLHTNKRTSGTYGMGGTKTYKITAEPGYQIVGLYSRSVNNKYLDSIGAVTKPLIPGVIELGPEMALEDDANVEMRATSCIRLNPGFRAKRSSYFHASIKQS